MRMAPRPRTEPYLLDISAGLTPAAALLLIYPVGDAWHVPLTRRGSQLRHHTGQISLPGGRIDPGESVEQTAVREAFEEVGLDPAVVELIGRLTPVPIPVSQFLLHPVVGFAQQRPAFEAAAGEVDRIIEVPVLDLLQPDRVRWEERHRSRRPEVLMDVPYFDVAEERIWGATAMVLSELVAVLSGIVPDQSGAGPGEVPSRD